MVCRQSVGIRRACGNGGGAVGRVFCSTLSSEGIVARRRCSVVIVVCAHSGRSTDGNLRWRFRELELTS